MKMAVLRLYYIIRKTTSHVGSWDLWHHASHPFVLQKLVTANRTPFAITLHLGLAQFPLALSSHSQFYQLGVVLAATHAVDLFLGLQRER